MNSAQAQAQLMVENTDLIELFSDKRSKKERMGEERRTIKRKKLKGKEKNEKHRGKTKSKDEQKRNATWRIQRPETTRSLSSHIALCTSENVIFVKSNIHQTLRTIKHQDEKES